VTGQSTGTAGRPSATHEDPPARGRARTYAAVLAVEAVVILVLWFFGRHFSS
jgi:hypothetical protein